VEYSYTQQLAGDSLTPILVFTLPAAVAAPTSIAFDNSGDLWGTSLTGSALFEYSATQIVSGGASTPAATIAVPAGPRTVALDPVPSGLPVSGPHLLAHKLKGPLALRR
jgi:hypothetical protein